MILAHERSTGPACYRSLAEQGHREKKGDSRCPSSRLHTDQRYCSSHGKPPNRIAG